MTGYKRLEKRKFTSEPLVREETEEHEVCRYKSRVSPCKPWFFLRCGNRLSLVLVFTTWGCSKTSVFGTATLNLVEKLVLTGFLNKLT
jgi:hypothetical protein